MLIQADGELKTKDLKGVLNFEDLGEGLESLKAKNVVYKLI